jgi:hypothetical protein
MVITASHPRNASRNQNETLNHTVKMSIIKIHNNNATFGEVVEILEFSYTVGGNIKW